MKRKKIVILASSVLLLLLVTISIQVYFVATTSKLIDEEFEKRVQTSLFLIGHQIEFDDVLNQSPDNPGNYDWSKVYDVINEVFEQNEISLPFRYIVQDEQRNNLYRRETPGYSSESMPTRQLFSLKLLPHGAASNFFYLRLLLPSTLEHKDNFLGMLRLLTIAGLLIFFSYIGFLALFWRQEYLNAMKNDFVDLMTHELKTPISTISLASQILKEQSDQGSETKVGRVLKIIRDETERLSSQLETILQVAFVERGSEGFDFLKINANPIIADVITVFSIKVANRGGKIVSKLNAENDAVLADTMHFTSVLFNLMDNALKYSTKSLLLTIETYNVDNNFVVSVEDNGIGIRKEDQKRIFDKFFRASVGNTPKSKGLGLGLAYVKNVIEKHKGVIVVESKYGLGTKFIISIPNLNNGL